MLNFGEEPYTDTNGNGMRDTAPPETYTDLNGNGRWDGPIALLPNPRHLAYQRYLKGFRETFTDNNGNGIWDATPTPEPYVDLNGNNQYDKTAVFANEDYDAADYQNMILAFVQASSTTSANIVPIPSLHRPALVNYWINASGGIGAFNANTSAAASLRRRVSLRPDHLTDHPAFTGGNPAYTPLDGPWDVDNDQDGVADSIWVDLGLPVETAPDGRQYKPLFAIMVLDMDGKLNLNVHGQLNDWNNDFAEGLGSQYNSNPSQQLVTLNRPANAVGPAVPEMAGTAAVTGQARLPAGLGLGPQEVSLSLTLHNSTPMRYALFDDAEFRQLLRGYYDTVSGFRYEGRLGESYLLPPATYSPTLTAHVPILAGRTVGETYTDANMNGVWDTGETFTDANGNGQYDGPDDNNPAAPPLGFGSPTDLDANGVLGLDPNGQPKFTYMGSLNANSVPETTNESAELDPTRRRRHVTANNNQSTNTDNPFSPADLEALLRRHDVDAATLSSRLVSLAPSLFIGNGVNSNYHAARVTTESWDIPAPSFTPTPEIYNGLRIYTQMTDAQPVDFSSLSILDLLRGKIVYANPKFVPANTVPPPMAPSISDATVVDDWIQNTLLPQDVIAPELLSGHRFNLNRPFWEAFTDADGNGQYDAGEPYADTNGNGQWDANDITEPYTDSNGNGSWDATPAPGEPYTDINGNGQRDAIDPTQRIRFARHLCFQVMLLKDYNYSIAVDNTSAASGMMSDRTETIVAAERKAITAQQIAQWAINVVEFRDADFTMTPFEFVVDPFEYDPAAIPTHKGWSVDDSLLTNEATLPPTDPSYNADRRLVWGCEEPVLLLTEAAGLHDRRVEDLPVGGLRRQDGVTGQYEDDVPMGTRGVGGYDQRRIPQGSAFFELYCARNPNNRLPASTDLFFNEPFTDSNGNGVWDGAGNGPASSGAEPYTDTNSNGQYDAGLLDLSKMAGTNPVWRMAISQSRIADPNNDVMKRVRDQPFSATLEPDSFNMISGARW